MSIKEIMKSATKRNKSEDKHKYWKNKASEKRFNKAKVFAEKVNQYAFDKNYYVLYDGELWNEYFIFSKFTINSTGPKYPNSQTMWVGNAYDPGTEFSCTCVWTEDMREIKNMFKGFSFMKVSDPVKINFDE